MTDESIHISQFGKINLDAVYNNFCVNLSLTEHKNISVSRNEFPTDMF